MLERYSGYMKEVRGNIWDYHEQGHWIVVPTNGTIKRDGSAVMGKGVALEAAKKFPQLPHILGKEISRIGNVLHHWGQEGLLLFPTKHDWWEKADIVLIEENAKDMKDFFDNVIAGYLVPIYLPRLGCGNGGLEV